MAQQIRAAEHALDVVQLLLATDDIGVSEVAVRIGVAPSTAHRLLTTLCSRGFAERTPSRRYRAGPAIAPSSRRAHELVGLVDALRPAVSRMFERVGETVHLLVLEGAEVQFIDGVEGSQALRVGLRIGGRIPAYCTSGGKAILAALDRHAVDELHAGGLAPWPGRRLQTMTQLHRELAQVRAEGIALNRGESETGVVALGRAIAHAGSAPVALAIAMPEARFWRTDRTALESALREGVDRASRLLAV